MFTAHLCELEMTPLCRESLGKPKGNVFARLQATAGAALPMPAGGLAALVVLLTKMTWGGVLSCTGAAHDRAREGTASADT